VTKHLAWKKGVCNILFIILCSAILANAFPPIIRGIDGNVKVKVDPPETIIGVEGQPIPSDPFTIKIVVTDVTKLASWQIMLLFNSSLVKCIDAFYPPDHVFADKKFVSLPPGINNDKGYIQYGCSILGDPEKENFNGTGTLCEIKFVPTREKNGTCDLTFVEGDTILQYFKLGYGWYDIPFTPEKGSVVVKGYVPQLEPSTISIEVDKTSVIIWETVTISGEISPSKPNVDVTITREEYTDPYSPPIVTSYSNKTDANSRYIYRWKANTLGTFKFTASWDGDATHQGSKSTTITVIVSSIDTTLYIGASKFSETAKLADFYTKDIVFGSWEKELVVPYRYTLYVFVSNITDLYAWRIKLYITNATVANCTAGSIWIPENHVFAGKNYVNTTASVERSNGGLYITFGANQTSPAPGYSVSGFNVGILCAINFTGITNATAEVHWIREATFLKDSSENDILFKFEVDPSTLTLAGKRVRFLKASTISLYVSAETVKVGSDVTISGDISPSRPHVNVTITFNGTNHVVVQTDENSHYTYVWHTSETGVYELKASWAGDNETEGASSDPRTVTVKSQLGEDYTLYIIIVVVVVLVIIGVVVYFKKFRKPKVT
jgi:hypothetical protein